jgi:uncharacterized phage protein (TIGR02220 family)
MQHVPEPPYAADTRYKGWRFELDLERVQQSDTWALASPDQRPWLLMLWTVSWQQNPCGSLPSNDELIAARIGMSLAAFQVAKPILMRGWWQASDGRLYHATITEHVLAMLAYKNGEARRKADWRARMAAEREAQTLRSAPGNVPKMSRGTDASVPRPSHVSDATRTGTRTGTGTRFIKTIVGQTAPDDAAPQPEDADHEPSSATGQDNRRTDAAVPAVPSKRSAEIEVLDYLNAQASRDFKPVPANTRLITARMREGADVAELKAVIDCKVREWRHDPKMSDYLRPKTLFNAANYAQYSGSLNADKPAKRAHGDGAWWLSDDTALAKAMKVGAGPARQGETKDQWHARIRAAIDNGGRPPAPRAAAPVAPPPAVAQPKAAPSDVSRANVALAKALLKQKSAGAGVTA